MHVRRVITVAGLLGAVIAMASPVHADDKALRKEIDAEYRRYIAAFKAKNFRALEALLPEDYTTKPPTGPAIPRRRAVIILVQTANGLGSITSMKVRIDTLAVAKAEVVTTVTEKIVGTINGPAGLPSKVERTATSRDVWSKTQAGWRRRYTVQISGTTLVDGKPLVPILAPGAGAGPGR